MREMRRWWLASGAWWISDFRLGVEHQEQSIVRNNEAMHLVEISTTCPRTWTVGGLPPSCGSMLRVRAAGGVGPHTTQHIVRAARGGFSISKLLPTHDAFARLVVWRVRSPSCISHKRHRRQMLGSPPCHIDTRVLDHCRSSGGE